MTFAKEEKIDDMIAMRSKSHTLSPSMVTSLSIILHCHKYGSNVQEIIVCQLESIIKNNASASPI